MLTKFRIVVAVSALIVSSLGVGLMTLRQSQEGERGTQVSAEAVGPPDGSQEEATEGQNGQPSASGMPGIPELEDVPFPDFDVTQFKSGTLDLQLTVNPKCAHQGDTMTAVLHAIPGTYVALQVSYNGAQGGDAYYTGSVGPDGSLTYPWVVSPEAREGQGIVFAAAHVEEGEEKRSGTVAADFKIVSQGKSC